MTKIAITAKSQAVLDAIAAGNTTREDIAESLNVSLPTVNGSLTALKRNGLAEVDDDGTITLTEDASEYITGGGVATVRGHRPGTKMAEAAKLFNDKFGQGRQAVLAAFQSRIGLTKAGAATYYQMLRTQAGMSHGVAFQRGKKKPAATKSRGRAH